MMGLEPKESWRHKDPGVIEKIVQQLDRMRVRWTSAYEIQLYRHSGESGLRMVLSRHL